MIIGSSVSPTSIAALFWFNVNIPSILDSVTEVLSVIPFATSTRTFSVYNEFFPIPCIAVIS